MIIHKEERFPYATPPCSLRPEEVKEFLLGSIVIIFPFLRLYLGHHSPIDGEGLDLLQALTRSNLFSNIVIIIVVVIQWKPDGERRVKSLSAYCSLIYLSYEIGICGTRCEIQVTISQLRVPTFRCGSSVITSLVP